MAFNSYTFILFFLVILGLHNLPTSWGTKKVNLLVASYLFYAAWNPPFVVLLWISTVIDWHVAKMIFKVTRPKLRVMFLMISLFVNLGLLGFFKYSNFVLENFSIALGLIGVEYQPLKLDIILPLGISFYTFQTLSYTLDIYMRRAKPWDSFLDYALYVTFFPQLVAGPIVRANYFLPQCVTPNRVQIHHYGWGLSLIVLGLFQKVVLADSVFAPVVESVYDSTLIASGTSAWTGTIAFAGQIFCDFSGYSTCAIGVAMCLGFRVPDNFRFPYAAIGFSDFWRRWHISLSSWLKDYLYIPLGGNRNGSVSTYKNLFLTMLIGGLWHGASWNFVIWGGLHGFYLSVERILKSHFGRVNALDFPVSKLLLGFLTFFLVCVSWVFFRSGTLDDSFRILTGMFGFVDLTVLPPNSFVVLTKYAYGSVLVCMTILLTLHWTLRNSTLEEVAKYISWWVKPIVLSAMIIAIAISPGEDRAFIYFQF